MKHNSEIAIRRFGATKSVRFFPKFKECCFRHAIESDCCKVCQTTNRFLLFHSFIHSFAALFCLNWIFAVNRQEIKHRTRSHDTDCCAHEKNNRQNRCRVVVDNCLVRSKAMEKSRHCGRWPIENVTMMTTLTNARDATKQPIKVKRDARLPGRLCIEHKTCSCHRQLRFTWHDTLASVHVCLFALATALNAFDQRKRIKYFN